MRFSTILAPVAFAASALAQTFSINTPPSLVQCQPASLSWVGGTGPFTIAAIPGGQTSAAAISFIATNVQSSPYTWNVNLPTGLSITLKINDNQGNIAYSSQLTIQTGASSSCLNTSASTSGLSTVAVSSTSAGSASASSAASTMSMSSMMSSSSAAASSSTANSVSAVSQSASSVSAVVSSIAASATSRSGAFATAVAGIPALAAGAIGAVAVLF